MRLDRMLTLYFFGPIARRRKLPAGSVRLPILMYHSISDDSETGHPYYWINTSPALFAEHMKYLHDNNYQVIPLSAAVDLIKSQGSASAAAPAVSKQVNQSTSQPVSTNLQLSSNTQHPTPKSVVLTFDDGYLDFYTDAFPVLKQYGFPATIFLPTDYIDGSKSGLRGKKHLTWDLVGELSKSGIDFGSHTCSHPQLCELTNNIIEDELRRSKESIESYLKKHIDSFCYPYKFPEGDVVFTRTLEILLKDMGFSNCTTTRIGSVHYPEEILSLKRIPINSADDGAFFSNKLAGGYDWLYCLQTLWKRLYNRKS